LFKHISKSSLLSTLSVAALFSACMASPVTETVPTPMAHTVGLTLRPILASTDIAIGMNRMVLGILDSDSIPIEASIVSMFISYEYDGENIPFSHVNAAFHAWPGGFGGVFIAQIDFPHAGTWMAEITPQDGNTTGERGRLAFKVMDKSSTPVLGSPAPHTHNSTSKNVTSLNKITTDPDPDPDLYSITIAEALEASKPLMVTFATPGLCVSTTCGPQVDVIKELKATYGAYVNFIHVEIYANPMEISGDINTAKVVGAVNEWGLPSEPWTFIVDAQGIIVAKFEAFTSYQELEAALAEILLG
ncbi:hypothetical protein M1N24_02690, partial [Dehalococcoidia bacterium]|nr:hypothetical protein [Dehalococcoidia bacterium]